MNKIIYIKANAKVTRQYLINLLTTIAVMHWKCTFNQLQDIDNY